MALFKKISELLETTELGFVIETVGGVSKKFNLANLGKKTQYETLPSASENAGKIFQYVGETNDNYTNGMFYVSLSNGQGQYGWFPSSIMQKVDNATTGDIATLDESGNVTDSGIAASNVIQKVSGATNGNFAGLDANGNLTDSGKKASNFKTVQTVVSDPTASGTSTTAITNITQDANGVIVPTKKTIVDTKNTAGSTDSSSKLYLVGATSQAANPQTYSDDEVYMTSGVLTTKSVQVGGGSATIKWDSVNNAIALGKLDIRNGLLGLIIGADSGSETRTDATLKGGRICLPHYTNAEEPVAMIMATSDTNNTVNIGGGTSLANAATIVSFYTAANSTTVTGTERMRINSSGQVGIGINNPSEKLHVSGNILASGDSASATKTIANKVRMEYDTTTDTLEFNFL